MILTDYFLRRKIRQMAKASLSRTHHYRSLQDVKCVLVMCEAKDWDEAKRCIGQLRVLGKIVHVCIYVRKKDQTPTWDHACLLIDEKDVNLWGFPDKRITDQLRGLPVDMLLDLTSLKTLVMRYLMLQQPSIFKVGAKRPSDDDVYDLAIALDDAPSNLSFLFKQILNYLQMIRSK